MIAVEFSFKPELVAEVARIQQRFPSVVKAAADRALRRAATTARRATVEALFKLLNVKRADLTARHRGGAMVDVVKPIGNNLTSGVSISSKRVPLIYFGAKLIPGRGRGWAAGVTWGVRRGRIKVIMNPRGPGQEAVFIGRGRAGKAESAEVAASGHVAVFRRRAAVKRLKVRQLMGPSIARVIENDSQVKAALYRTLSDTFAQRMKHELAYALQQKLFPTTGSAR